MTSTAVSKDTVLAVDNSEAVAPGPGDTVLIPGLPFGLGWFVRCHLGLGASGVLDRKLSLK